MNIQTRFSSIMLGVVLAVMGLIVSAHTTLAAIQSVKHCATGYHVVYTVSGKGIFKAPFIVTACAPRTWKTVVYSFVPDPSVAEQTLFKTTAPKKKAVVQLYVQQFTAADSLTAALNLYFSGSIPTTLTYTTGTSYFHGADIALDQTSTATVVYKFDATNHDLYILSEQATTSTLAKQAEVIGASVTAKVN